LSEKESLFMTNDPDKRRRVSVSEVLSLPRPTDSQCDAFIAHLADVHSWYKHLPLLGGSEFIVFLDAQAGRGYPLEHPRLPTSRTPEGNFKPNTIEAYRSAFGHLNYLWRQSPLDSIDSDGGYLFETPIVEYFLAELGRFTLYPYVSGEFYWSFHKNAVTAIHNGAYHPMAELILRAFTANSQLECIWGELSNTQRELTSVSDDPSLVSIPIPEPVVRYREIKRNYHNLMNELRTPEIEKIHNHVHGLIEWHTQSNK
jgi:hypothetical protein